MHVQPGHDGGPWESSCGRLGSPGVVTLVVGWVNAAQDQLTAFLARLVAVQPEGKHRLFDYALLHQVLEGWHCPAYGDAGEAQTLQARSRIDAERPLSALHRALSNME